MSDKIDSAMRLLGLAAEEAASRKGSYNGRENSFEFIARRFAVWFRNNLDLDVPFDGAMVADLMVEFKRGRGEARKAAGAMRVEDDAIDAASYMAWAFDLLDASEAETETPNDVSL